MLKSKSFMYAKLACCTIAGCVAFCGCKPAVEPKPAVSSTAPKIAMSDVGSIPKFETSGFQYIVKTLPKWKADASLKDIAAVFDRVGYRTIEKLDQTRAAQQLTPAEMIDVLTIKAALLNYEGQPHDAYQSLQELREYLADQPDLIAAYGSTLDYLQGVAALRLGETENCIMCRGESSCILPISEAARHINPEGSRLAIRHFLKCATRDFASRWLMNIAAMTLGDYPDKVDPRWLIPLEKFARPEFDIGAFRDVGNQLKVDQLTEAGGAIVDDFDNDGALDLVITTFDPTGPMNVLFNNGQGTFDDKTLAASVGEILGGANCMQADFNNDGFLDIFIVRGAWMTIPMPMTLLMNNGDRTFSDVTAESGLADPVNSITASWADYDSDGFLDLFVCCEQQPSRLYHNEGNNTFRLSTAEAGIDNSRIQCKGSAWTDYDNDGFPDLFLDYITSTGGSELYHNERDGTFRNVTKAMGIDGPTSGFSCWSWDYDNDGWLDLFATSYDRTLEDVVHGMQGDVTISQPSRLYHNRQGQGFDDVTRTAGVDMPFAAMGSNYGDFDNDGFLDFYLGTGDPDIASLVPNRMFRNVDGKRFSEITASARTGSLQKGHSVCCGDWDRDGNVDVFIEMGGAIPGDKYHNILFQNPGHDAHWLTLKLIGLKGSRGAIGARITIVTDEPTSRTICRHISSGSSFGANPLLQTIGIGQAERIARLEIRWPGSETPQVFEKVSANQAIQIMEADSHANSLTWSPIPVPAD